MCWDANRSLRLPWGTFASITCSISRRRVLPPSPRLGDWLFRMRFFIAMGTSFSLQLFGGSTRLCSTLRLVHLDRTFPFPRGDGIPTRRSSCVRHDGSSDWRPSCPDHPRLPLRVRIIFTPFQTKLLLLSDLHRPFPFEEERFLERLRSGSPPFPVPLPDAMSPIDHAPWRHSAGRSLRVAAHLPRLSRGRTSVETCAAVRRGSRWRTYVKAAARGVGTEESRSWDARKGLRIETEETPRRKNVWTDGWRPRHSRSRKTTGWAKAHEWNRLPIEEAKE